MKIHAAVKQLPYVAYRGTKWQKVYEAVKSIKHGQWLPVSLDSKQERERLYGAARQHGYRTARGPGNTIFISKKDAG